jgi:hypothetical protein
LFILKAYHKIAFIILVNLCCLLQNNYAQDTVFISKPPKHTFKAEPFRATMLAIALPGFGQIYNRKYYKVPFVYIGFATIAYFINFNSKEYNIYMKAYQDFTDNIPATASYIPLLKNADPREYDPVLYPNSYNPSSAAWYRERMLLQVDYSKKYRDLSYIGIAAWYLYTILDANVDASLHNYDISNDLDLKIEPVVLPLSSRAGVGISLKLTF